MKSVSALSDAERASLERAYRHGPAHRPRQRAHAVLLSAGGLTLGQIARVCEVHAQTVSGWFNRWQARGLDGLADAPKPGRRRKIDAPLEADLLDLLRNPTPDLKAVVQAHLGKKAGRSPGTPSSAASGGWVARSDARGASRPKRRPKRGRPA